MAIETSPRVDPVDPVAAVEDTEADQVLQLEPEQRAKVTPEALAT